MILTKPIALLCAGSFAAALSALPALAQADRYDAALAWAQCIRDNGYAEFPDPDPEGGFQFLIDRSKSELFRAATTACRNLAPEGMRDEGVTAAELDALIKLSQCVRQNGIPDFPDPAPQGSYNLGSLGIDPGDARLDAALTKCQAEGGSANLRITIGG